MKSPIEKYLSGDSRVTVTGCLYQKEEKLNYQILYLKNNSILYLDDTYQKFCIKEPYLIVYDKNKESLQLGNIVKITGNVSFFEDARNPGNFSEKNYYAVRKIHAGIWGKEVVCLNPKIFWIRNFLYDLKQKWSLWLMEVMGEEDGGILSAMLLGEKQLMDPDIKELYQVNGMAHILAISGLHLSFIGLGFYSIVRRYSGSYLFGGIVGMSFLLLYIMMIGTTVSAVRAVVMFCVRVGADMSGRVYDALTSLSLAAVIVIIWRPLSFYDAGFQLSFGAFFAILFMYPTISGRKEKRKKITSWSEGIKQFIWGMKDSLAVSISIQTVTLPMLMWHYFEIPLYSVFLNLIVIPLMSVVLGFGFCGSILGMIMGQSVVKIFAIIGRKTGKILLMPCKEVLHFYQRLCLFCSKLPGQRIVTGQPDLKYIFIYYACLFFFLLLRWNTLKRNDFAEKEIKKYIFKSIQVDQVLMISGICLLLSGCPAYHPSEFEVTYLDVGQGDCAFLREKNGPSILIDGGSLDVSGVWKYRMKSFLKSEGVANLDYVFVSHGDNDHIGGIMEMLEDDASGITVNCLVFPEKEMWDEKLEELYLLAKSKGISCGQISKGEVLAGKSNRLQIECLGPTAGTEIGNATSMILGIHYENQDFLFVGDVEGEGEKELIDTLRRMAEKNQKYDVLKVAHHGSKNSTTDSFLDVVKPDVGIISAGKNNQYGHPHKETLDRLKEHGCMIISTQDRGAIRYLY